MRYRINNRIPIGRQGANRFAGASGRGVVKGAGTTRGRSEGGAGGGAGGERRGYSGEGPLRADDALTVPNPEAALHDDSAEGRDGVESDRWRVTVGRGNGVQFTCWKEV